MKIVILVPALVVGGAETMVARLATSIDCIQNDVQIICTHPKVNSFLERKIEDAGITIHYIEKEKKSNILIMMEVFGLLTRIKPDVVHSHINSTFFALPWIFLHKAKLVHTIHTKPDVEFSRRLTRLLRFATLVGKVVLVAVSRENYAIAKDFYKAKEHQIKYVNNPVDTEYYYHNDGRADGHIIFINVSRQDSNKNQIMAIRAMADVIKKVPKAKLVLVGDGNQHENLIREREALGLTEIVELPGATKDPKDYLANADIYLSTSHQEGLPLSMLEAMASGLPVIATNVGGVSDIVCGNGVLISDGDLNALVTEMIRFATDRDMAKHCGKQSLEIVKKYDSKICAEAYVKIYSETI